MNDETKAKLLARMGTRNEAGRHFTETYSPDQLGELEDAGLIEIYRAVHEATGIAYDSQYWQVHVTEDGVLLIESEQPDVDTPTLVHNDKPYSDPGDAELVCSYCGTTSTVDECDVAGADEGYLFCSDCGSHCRVEGLPTIADRTAN